MTDSRWPEQNHSKPMDKNKHFDPSKDDTP